MFPGVEGGKEKGEVGPQHMENVATEAILLQSLLIAAKQKLRPSVSRFERNLKSVFNVKSPNF